MADFQQRFDILQQTVDEFKSYKYDPANLAKNAETARNLLDQLYSYQETTRDINNNENILKLSKTNFEII